MVTIKVNESAGIVQSRDDESIRGLDEICKLTLLLWDLYSQHVETCCAHAIVELAART